jgi:hypothetical protein
LEKLVFRTEMRQRPNLNGFETYQYLLRRTMLTAKYSSDPAYRRKITRQLDKGEPGPRRA